MQASKIVFILFLSLLVLSPFVVDETQAIAIDKKKIYKALFLAKLAAKKKKLIVLPLPIPLVLQQKKHVEHHEFEGHHHGW